MLSIEILCVGRLNQKFYNEGCEEYLKRLSAFARVKVTELSEIRQEGDSPACEQKVVIAESKKMLEYIQKKRTTLVAMCVEGTLISSQELANFIDKTTMVSSDITFVIGGSFGLSDEIKAKATLKMSMSKMTFTHQLARVILLEQIYRACTINGNIKYHK